VNDIIRTFYITARRFGRSKPFRVGLLGGLVGVLIDGDHLIAYLLGWPPTSERFLHVPIFVGVCLALVGMGAYTRRLYVKAVLKEKRCR
jgi:hypothetical protein